MTPRQTFFLLSLLVPLAGCSTPKKIEFTQQLRSEHQLKPEEVQQLQFYISEKLVLERERTSSERDPITGGNHALVVRGGLNIEVITFEKLLPGIARSLQQVGDRHVDVSFEAVDGASLHFATEEVVGPEERDDDRFARAPNSAPIARGPSEVGWGKYVLLSDRGLVPYAGKAYTATGRPHLLIDEDEFNKLRRIEKKPGGLKHTRNIPPFLVCETSDSVPVIFL